MAGPRKAPADNPVLSGDREPPHSIELERTLLAALLDGRHATAIHVLREHAEHPLVFFVRDHRLIYQACLDLDDDGQRVDAQVVAELLRRSSFTVSMDRLRRQELLLEEGALDGLDRRALRSLYRRRDEDEAASVDDSALAAVGGFGGLANLLSAYAGAAGLDGGATLLRDYYLKRRLISGLGRIVDHAFRTTDTFQTLAERGGQVLLSLDRGDRGGGIRPIETVVDETLEAIQKASDGEQHAIATGYTEVDDMLTSLRPGGLYILAARPGVGKTSFALSVVQHICGDSPDPQGVLFFSLEVDRVDLVKKLLCGRADIDFKAIERGLIEEAEWEALSAAAQDFKRWRLDLMDVSDLTVQGLRSVVKRHVLERQGSLRCIVIDYLQLLNSSRPDASEYEKISEITRTLKIMAKDLRIPVIALSQLNRESERAAGKPREPRLSELRGSGSIEQDADAVLFLHRVDEEDDRNTVRSGRDVKLIVAKNRFGPTGAMALKFFPGRQRFAVVANQADGSGEVVARDTRFEGGPAPAENLFE